MLRQVISHRTDHCLVKMSCQVVESEPAVIILLSCRWFDKSFSVVYYKNGKNGINAEHSWADAPVLSHLWEVSHLKEREVARCCRGWGHLMVVVCLQYTLATDCFQLGYNAEGHCKGEVDSSLPRPQKLNWEIPPEVSCHSHISPNSSSPLANRTLAATTQKLLHHQRFNCTVA